MPLHLRVWRRSFAWSCSPYNPDGGTGKLPSGGRILADVDESAIEREKLIVATVFAERDQIGAWGQLQRSIMIKKNNITVTVVDSIKMLLIKLHTFFLLNHI